MLVATSTGKATPYNGFYVAVSALCSECHVVSAARRRPYRRAGSDGIVASIRASPVLSTDKRKFTRLNSACSREDRALSGAVFMGRLVGNYRPGRVRSENVY